MKLPTAKLAWDDGTGVEWNAEIAMSVGMRISASLVYRVANASARAAAVHS